MTQRFIKLLLDSPESDYLQQYHPNAFLLLCLIAKRARRTLNSPDGLQIGEALMGDYKSAGIETRDKYRTALDVLVRRNHIKIIATCRSKKNCVPAQNVENKFEHDFCPTTTPTSEGIKGTKLKLLKSDIWDINPEVKINQDPHIHPHPTPTSPPPHPHEQERKRKKKKEEELKEKNIKKEKIKIREWVALTQIEIDAFFEKHDKDLANQMLDILDSYNTSRQKHYDSDYGALKTAGWVFNEAKKRNNLPANKKASLTSKVKHGAIYKNHECYITSDEIAFMPLMGQSSGYRIRLKDPLFEDQFLLIANKLGIAI